MDVQICKNCKTANPGFVRFCENCNSDMLAAIEEEKNEEKSDIFQSADLYEQP